ncbi:S-layer homology domain-containing protein [Paenibacillus sp. WLX2291]|uniref:S-layer homology domain-containing protein n=1 Tax=Paenibacillus sp. WLX2291 TaxID=3296934 RepID=UPI0039844AA7
MRRWQAKTGTGLAAVLLASSILPSAGWNPTIAEAAEHNETAHQVTIPLTAAIESTSLSPGKSLLSTASEDTYSIASARQQTVGHTVVVQGIVTYRQDTGSGYSNLYIQDNGAGIVVRGSNLSAQQGQSVRVSGTLGAYRNLLQISASASNVTVIDPNSSTPAPTEITSADFAADNPYEARLVTVNTIEVDSVSGSRYTVSDDKGTFVVYSTEPWLETGKSYRSITGVVTRYNNEYQLIPRSVSDIAGSVPPVEQEPLKLTISQIQGTAQTSTYADELVQQVEGIVTMVKSKSSFYMQMPDELDDGDNRTSQAILVYRASHGMKVGDQVSVDGSVKEYRETGYSDAADLTTTEIAATAIRVQNENQTLPKPTVIGAGGRTIPSQIASPNGFVTFDPSTYSIDFYESLEGMRIQLNDADIIGPYGYEIPVSVDVDNSPRRTPAGGLIITDGEFNANRLLIAEKPKQPIKTGDRFDGAVTGIMSYSYSNFKLLPDATLPTIIDGGWKREVSALHNGDKQLSIASFNVENFWDDPANTAKTERIARNVIDNLHTPDIIGLMEVQDNNGATDDGTTDASASFGALIRDIVAAGGPEYRYASIAPQNNEDGGAPGGNIRVGFLYNPARVSLPQAAGGVGDSVTAVTYGPQGLSVNPGRIDPQNPAFADSRKSLAAQFEFHGQTVIVIANHLNSKGGDQPLYGSAQPPVRSSEVQRAKQAAALNQFVQDTLAQNSNANVVLVGDFNDFQFSNTFNILKGTQLTNLVDTLPVNERYSYVYEGNSQTLDHVLMTPGIADKAKLDIVHLNADFMEEDGRVSDHDPLLTVIDFAKKGHSDDDDDDSGSNAGGGSGNTGVGTGNGGGGGTTTPTIPPTTPIVPTATSQGLSADGKTSRWVFTPTISEQNGSQLRSVTITADHIQQMLSSAGAATSLQINLDSNDTTGTFQVQLASAATQALTSQQQVQQLVIQTPVSSYTLPITLVRESVKDAQSLVLDITPSPAAITQASLLGYTARVAVDYNLYTWSSNTSQPITELNGYIQRSIPIAGIRSSNRLAVARVEEASNGSITYTPVPFTVQDDTVTVFSRSNSTYVVLDAKMQTWNDMNSHWAASSVQQLADRMIINGTAKQTFSPSAAITRAQMAALLTRALGLSKTATGIEIGTENTVNDGAGGDTDFSDVASSAWYADSIHTAAIAGLLQGDTSGKFRPNDTITRQEMAVMLDRVIQQNHLLSATAAESASNPMNRFPDLGQSATWARQAIVNLDASGLLQGNESGLFKPQNSLTRAESASIITRLLDKITNEKLDN